MRTISSHWYLWDVSVPNKHGTSPNDSVPPSLSADQQPLTKENLREALEIFRYDMHKELQGIIREQVRQFEIAKQDNAALMEQMSEQLRDLLDSNRELRNENERLRHIY